VTLKRPPPLAAGIGGVDARDQDVPFQLSTRGENVEFELMLLMVTPTAQQEKLLAQEEPSTMSSAARLLLGLVTIFQLEPEGEA
jgi:hypothetical protein